MVRAYGGRWDERFKRISHYGGGRVIRATHEIAVQWAINEYVTYWLPSKDAEPPDPDKVRELLRHGRTEVGLELKELHSRFPDLERRILKSFEKV
jgi:hypothetical protein